MYDFLSLYEACDLDNPPSHTVAACIAFIILHPVPIQVYNYLPRLALNRTGDYSDFKLSYTKDSLEIISNAGIRGQRTGDHIWCANDEGSFSSCATRVLAILGVRWQNYHTDSLDPDKVGMLLDDLDHFLQLAAVAEIKRIDFPREYTPGECPELSADCYGGTIVLACFRDHIAFWISKQLFFKASCYIAELQPRQKVPLSELRAELKDKYPPNAGRAGGKVFLDFDTVLPTVYSNPYSYALAHRLQKSENDWEMVAAIAIVLLPFTELTGEDIAIFLLQNWELFSHLDFVDYVKWCKKVHNHVRMVGALPGYLRIHPDVTQDRQWCNNIYGIDIIGGRSELMSLDFTKETVMRMADPSLKAVPVLDRDTGMLMMSRTLYEEWEDDATQEAVRSIVKRGADGVILEDFDTWFSRRMFWGASGGAPGAVAKWTRDNEKLRLNKRGALLNISTEYMRRMLAKAESAVQWSVKALKFESAKLRSILNTSIESYIIQAYFLDNFDRNLREDTWHSSSHGMFARIAGALRRLENLRTGHALMWDFADFNINHSFSGIVKLFEVTAQVLIERGQESTPGHIYKAAVEDLRLALKWIRNARLNTYIQDNDTGFITRIVRSLQSGERATSWVNTMRNQIDFLIVKRTGWALFSRPFLTQHEGDKQGDDVFLPTGTMKDAVLACSLYNLTGAAGQLSKITNDYAKPNGARGEFLRYAYDGNKQVMSGYPIRAMMGIIHGEFFDEPIPKPMERAATFVEQANKLRRRGWHMPIGLLDRIIKRNCHLVYTSAAGIKSKVVVDKSLVELPACLGGIGVTNTIDGKNMLASDTIPSFLSDSDSFNGYVAIYIPSGEGKSTLARKFGSRVVDHDTLVGPALNKLRLVATDTGDWKPVNRYLRDCACHLNNCFLLTWGPDTCPSENRVGEHTLMLRTATPLRANKANRRSLIKANRKLELADSHEHLFHLFSRIVLKYTAILEGNRSTYTVRVFKSDTGEPPIFQYPRLPASAILRKSKTHLIDYDAAHKMGISQTDFIDEAALESSLTAAYPKRPLYDAIALYARKLHSWYSSGRFIDITVSIPKDSPRAFAYKALIYFFEGIGLPYGSPFNGRNLTLNLEGYPVTRNLSHHYNSIDRLIKISGCSLGLVLRRLIDHQQPLKYQGKLGRLYNYLTLLKRKKDSTIALSNSYNEVHILSDFTSFVDQAMEKNGKDNETCNNIYAYICGGSSFIPPYNPGINGEIISALRAACLVTLENHYLNRITLSQQQLCIWFAKMEFATLAILNEEYLSLSESAVIKD